MKTKLKQANPVWQILSSLKYHPECAKHCKFEHWSVKHTIYHIGLLILLHITRIITLQHDTNSNKRGFTQPYAILNTIQANG